MDPVIVPDIDALLERYLVLLDEYTSLRAELSRLQTATFHHLARANFAAERGVRFGQDYYDERMQAGRRVVMAGAAGVDAQADKVTWEVVVVENTTTSTATTTTECSEVESDTPESEEKKSKTQNDDEEGRDEVEDESHREEEEEEKKAPKQEAKKPISKDPIRWFGLLTPLALRQTQASAIETVERVIPRLVTVDAEMRQVEIEVRRARKRRAKAETAAAAAAAKQDLGQEAATRAEVAAS